MTQRQPNLLIHPLKLLQLQPTQHPLALLHAKLNRGLDAMRRQRLLRTQHHNIAHGLYTQGAHLLRDAAEGDARVGGFECQEAGHRRGLHEGAQDAGVAGEVPGVGEEGRGGEGGVGAGVGPGGCAEGFGGGVAGDLVGYGGEGGGEGCLARCVDFIYSLKISLASFALLSSRSLPVLVTFRKIVEG